MPTHSRKYAPVHQLLNQNKKLSIKQIQGIEIPNVSIFDLKNGTSLFGNKAKFQKSTDASLMRFGTNIHTPMPFDEEMGGPDELQIETIKYSGTGTNGTGTKSHKTLRQTKNSTVVEQIKSNQTMDSLDKGDVQNTSFQQQVPKNQELNLKLLEGSKRSMERQTARNKSRISTNRQAHPQPSQLNYDISSPASYCKYNDNSMNTKKGGFVPFNHAKALKEKYEMQIKQTSDHLYFFDRDGRLLYTLPRYADFQRVEELNMKGRVLSLNYKYEYKNQQMHAQNVLHGLARAKDQQQYKAY